MTTIYFSKMNLNSHIYEVYEAENSRQKLNEILKDIYVSIRDDIYFEKNIFGFDEEGTQHQQVITYKIVQIDASIDETGLAIAGRLVKNATLFISKLEDDGTITKLPVENDEVVDFYFDIEKEIIAYNRSHRFGHKEINEAFENILNKMFEEEIADKEDSLPYYIKMENLREGLSIENIKTQLKEIGRIKELTLEIVPPNPDGDILDDMGNDGEGYLKELQEARITHRKLTLTSRDAAGLQIDEELIEEELGHINNIHSELSSERAIENGYVVVQGVSQNGMTFSTRDSKVRSAKIETTNRLSEFASYCRDKIQQLRRRE